ncbi:MAG TPA: AbrB/MazE/SpoVT family DNA-binding domain-containing protein [Acetobacteraceae bacterium]|nr:AbrB/MazE/SpoVT family DNA-binding domain-containing protein [Acetobacteraceae bacterium]
MDTLTKVSESGKLNLPAQIRRQIGLEQGGPVLVRLEDGEIRIRTVRDVMARLQAQAQSLFSGSGYAVDDFLRERREEAAREGAPE